MSEYQVFYRQIFRDVGIFKSKALGLGKRIGFSDRLVIGSGVARDQAKLLPPFRRAGIDELIHIGREHCRH